MKRLWNTFVLLLAVNFLALAGFVGWLFQSGHLDHARVTTIRETVFPPPQPAAPATQPASEGPVSASKQLQDLLAKHSGHSAAEQVELIQQTVDAATVQLDRREREVADRERQVASANAKLVEDRKALEAERQRLTDQQRETDRLAADKGFQDTLSLYTAMPARQAKGVFMKMDDTSAAQYFDAMEPRTATKILKEFKLPEEVDRMNRILDKMRRAPGAATPTTEPAKG